MAINTRQFVLSVRKEQQKAVEVRHAAVRALGNYARDRVRSRIPPGASEAAGIAFPGYKATGHLKGHFQTFGAVKNPKSSRITVGLVRNAGRMARIKAFVHEYGMRIHAKKAPFLVFKIGDKWISVKSVYIRPKLYFKTGWAAAQQGAASILAQYMQANWGK